MAFESPAVQKVLKCRTLKAQPQILDKLGAAPHGISHSRGDAGPVDELVMVMRC